jgi:hypothetical protein
MTGLACGLRRSKRSIPHGKEARSAKPSRSGESEGCFVDSLLEKKDIAVGEDDGGFAEQAWDHGESLGELGGRAPPASPSFGIVLPLVQFSMAAS